MSRVLIVDDEASIRRSLAGLLADEGWEVADAASGDAASAMVRDEAGRFDVVLLDIAMPGRDGIAVLEDLRGVFPELPVVMMSGHGNVETAVRATRLGAFDFIEKPLSAEKLFLTLQHAVEQSRLANENRRLRGQALRAHEILGSSEPILRLKQQISQAAPTNGWVLITGENGTGKELVARQVHLQSRRVAEPFVEVNCAAIPEELIESELFGHEKGAFTGAIARKLGKFEMAHRGTLFLDEVADMSLKTQAKVLRVLQESKFERVGGNDPIEVDVRVIAATNRDLESLIGTGAFREDLYYRLAVIPFHVPPLRERSEDIPALARAFVVEFCAEAATRPKVVAPRAMEALQAYPWPGNVRELRNLMERLVLMTPGARIERADLPGALHLAGRRDEDSRTGTLEEARRAFEREFLVAKLREHGWNVSRTAEAVGLARESLSRKIRALKIETSRGGS